MRKAGVVTYLFGDHLGSTSVVFDDSTNGIQRQGYRPFGEKRYPTGPSPLPTDYQYTGQRGFEEIGLYFYNARWYDGALGRFTQADTVIPDDTQGVQAWDRYAYVSNSPIRYNDPSGHCMVLCTAIIGGAIGAIVGAVGYTAYTAVTGNEFDVGTMLLAAGGGAAAGALIGTGVGIAQGLSTAAATTAAVTTGSAVTSGTSALLTATGGDPTDEISVATNAFGNLSQAANYGVQHGDKLKTALQSTGLQAHHIIEQRLAPALQQSSEQARRWLSVAVTPKEHQVFTNAWRNAIGYVNSSNPVNTATVTATDVWNAAQKIYADYPALLAATQNVLSAQ